MGLKLEDLSPTRARGDLDGLPLAYEMQGDLARVTIAGKAVLQDPIEGRPSVAEARRTIYAAIARFRTRSKPVPAS